MVVIAVDEETYRRPPFRDIPKAMWTNQFAGIIEATLNAGARVVGFDVIFSASVEQYLSGFDRSFLLALRNGSTQGKIVLGKVQHQVKPIGPHRSQSFAVGHQKNIRSVNLSEDNDGIIRRLPLTFRARTVDNQIRTETSMALELASRGLGQSPQATDNGSLRLGDYLIPGSRQNNMTLNFDGAVNAIPTLSLADVHRCVEVGNVEFLKEHLAGKVVLFGSVLDVEDRKLTSKRFITVREDIGQTQRCSYPIMSGLYRDDLVRDTIPGVFVHATAINNLMRGDALREFDSWVPVAISFSVAPVGRRGDDAVCALARGCPDVHRLLRVVRHCNSDVSRRGGLAALRTFGWRRPGVRRPARLSRRGQRQRQTIYASGIFILPVSRRHRAHDIAGQVAGSWRRIA